VEGFAVLPDGATQWLLRITNWDFNWQGDYTFRKPIFVPKGSTLTMRWTYDNSTNNVRNPNHPPVRVVYGPNSTNEMAELSFRMRLRNPKDAALLEQGMAPKILQDAVEFNKWRLQQNPDDPLGHARLGQALLHFPGRAEEGRQHLLRAIELNPELDEAHYALGLLLRNQGQFGQARAEFEKVVALNPDHMLAHGNLGFVLAKLQLLDRAEDELRTALRLNPDDVEVRAGLTELLDARARLARSKQINRAK
jgi:tetratricopeptide (TPR) repeat protein